MQTTVINILGGAGIGKSTTAAGLFTLLKMHDVECELISEFAKDLVWEERYKILFENQEYIFGEQYRRLWIVKDKVEYAIMECPLILGITYGNYYKSITKSYADSIAEIVNRFNNINIVLERNTKYNPKGRAHTEDEAKAIDTLIIKTLEQYNMPYTKIKGDYSCINNILKMLLKEEPKFKVV